jgi:hypothetical protein
MQTSKAPMKSHLPLAVAGILSVIGGGSLWAEDWTTTDGKVYQGVTVVKSEPDAVTILYRDGGTLVPLAKLPSDLQKRFNYDPVRAKLAADVRIQADAKSAEALQAEIEQTKKQKALALAAEKAKNAKASPPATETQDDPLNTKQFDLNSGQNDPNHHRDLTYPLHSDPPSS